MPNYDDLKNFPSTPQGSRDAGAHEGRNYDRPAPQQPNETLPQYYERTRSFDETKRNR